MMLESIESYAIVADIGGTFARFSCVHLETLRIHKIEIYSCAAFPDFESAFLNYQSQHSLQAITQVAIAIACPVLDDVICMTNAHWRFSMTELKHQLGLSELKILNDFNAIAMSLPVLDGQALVQIGKGQADKNKARVVLGAGTGLGVASLLTNSQGYVAHAGEGGHVSWGAKTEQEWFISCYLSKKHVHLSYERLLSGQGLENLYQALSAFYQQQNASLSAEQIINLALTQQCMVAKAAVAQFLAILGTYAGDLALIFAAFGGCILQGE